MARLIILGILLAGVSLVWTLFSSSKKKSGAAMEMVRCSQCDTFVPEGESLVRPAQGQTRHFCGHACADRFFKEHNV